MPAIVKIEDGFVGGGATAGVTNIGQLITAPFEYDTTKFVELDVIDTAYNFYAPIHGKLFVITNLIIKADFGVSNSADATVVIYEAETPTTLTPSRILLQVAMVRNELVPISPMNLLIGAGMFVNAKTTDDDIHMTIMGYYRPA